MNKVLIGDATEELRGISDASVQCVVTSPPYFGLRDYGVDGQLGLEKTPQEYVAKMVEVFREVRRVLKDDGTLWLNLGDSYNNASTRGNGATGGRDKSTLASRMPPVGTTPTKKNTDPNLKTKDLIGIPWRVAFALQADGWYLRQDIIWQKPNPMPESVTDRCTKSHEYLFLLTKSPRYYFDHEAIKEPSKGSWNSNKGFKSSTQAIRQSVGFAQQGGTNPRKDENQTGRNRRSVWTITTRPYKGAHFAVFPEALVEPCVKAGSKEGDIVCDPFAGSGTTLAVAKRLGRKYLGIELNEKYLPLIEARLK